MIILESDLREVDGVIVAVDIELINGTIESYDPISTVEVIDDYLLIDNTFHKHHHKLSDIVKVNQYTRTLVTDEFGYNQWIDSNYEEIKL